jgi:sugar phosphate isomerase/epimerase
MKTVTTRKDALETGRGLFSPKLAMCNFISGMRELKEFACLHNFSGIDYSFDMESLPGTPSLESGWVKEISFLEPLEVRYHCPFERVDLGHDDAAKAEEAEILFQRIIRLVSKAGGKFVTIHIGLGHDSTEPLSWETTLEKLRRLVNYGRTMRVQVCLENLAWGWTSKPNLFEKLIRRSGAGVTLDIGHAHACESVQSRQYTFEDFVSPHTDKVYNAHIYHTEIPELGHVTPEKTEDVQDRLSLLKEIGCLWWVIEIRNGTELLKARRIVDEFLRKEYVPVAAAHDML